MLITDTYKDDILGYLYCYDIVNINVFNKDDEKILLAVADGKYCVRGLANKDIRKQLISKNSNQVSRILKRLRMHGIIKKIRKSYRYHLTVLGKQVIS
jgi:hypothetical protein